MQRRIDAVIFDFDGVLVRSIELHALSYQVLMHPLGVPAPTLDILLLEGARSETILRTLLERAGRTTTTDELARLAALKQKVFQAIGQPTVYPGAEDAVRAIAERGFPLALASGTRRENVPKLAPQIAPLFQHIVTQEQYTHDKPHPEPYLVAAKRLGVAPERCLVVENAPFGIQAALTAGTLVVGVPTTLPADRLAAAHVVVRSIRDVPGVVPERPGLPPRE